MTLEEIKDELEEIIFEEKCSFAEAARIFKSETGEIIFDEEYEQLEAELS